MWSEGNDCDDDCVLFCCCCVVIAFGHAYIYVYIYINVFTNTFIYMYVLMNSCFVIALELLHLVCVLYYCSVVIAFGDCVCLLLCSDCIRCLCLLMAL